MILYSFFLGHGATDKFGGGNFGQSVNGYYRLGQAYPRNKLRQWYADKRRSRSEYLRYFQIINLNNTVTQTLEFNQTAAAVQGLDQSVTQSLLFEQTVATVLFNSVSQTLIFNQDVSTAGSEHNVIVTQTLIFNQTATGDNVKDVFQTLIFNQTATADRIHNLKQTLFFIENIFVNHDAFLSITDTLIFLDSASFDIDQAETVSQTLVFNQTAIGLREHSEVVNQTLVFNQTALSVREVFVAQTLIFTQQATFALDKFRTASQTLIFTDVTTRNIDDVQIITQTLEFINGRQLDTGLIDGNGNPIFENIPGAIGIVVHGCTVILKAPGKTIVLPCPIFGDSEALSVEMNLDRTITGSTFTYVKTSELRLYSYTFELTRDKARELREFLLTNNSIVMTLQDWKGQVIKGNITNNPFDFVAKSRWHTCSEKIEIALDFEGLKIAG